MSNTYEGRSKSLEDALKLAHEKAFKAINSMPGRKTDFLVSRVIEWGFRKGGIVGEEEFYVQVAEVAKQHAAGRDDT